MIARVFAHTFSIVFHPLLILTYVLLFLIWVNPYEFGGGGLGKNLPLVASAFLYTFAMPAFALIMMKYLGLVGDLKLSKREDRIIPYIAAGVFYCWLSVNAFYTSVYPKVYTIFIIGSTIALFLAFIVNNYSKISIHTVGMGGLVTMIFFTLLFFSYDNIEVFLLLSILFAGAVGTSRLLLKAHTSRQVYSGYLVGLIGQAISFLIFH